MSLDLMRARVAFRDRAFMDVMDLALRFMMVHAWLYAKVAMMVIVPALAVTLAAAYVWGPVAGWLFALFFSFAAQIPFTVLASRLVFQPHVSARAVVRSAAREVPRILVMRVMWTVIMVAATMVAIVPGVIVGGMLVFVDEVMILERARVVPAFGRAQRITTGALGEATLAVVLLAAVSAAAVLLADIGGRAFIGELLQFRSPEPFWSTGASVLAFCGFFAVMPYAATLRFFTYLNVRTRAEGWDIQTRFAAIALRADQEQPA